MAALIDIDENSVCELGKKKRHRSLVRSKYFALDGNNCSHRILRFFFVFLLFKTKYVLLIVCKYK